MLESLQLQVLDALNPDAASPLDYLFIFVSLFGNWKVLALANVLVFLKNRRLGFALFLTLLITVGALYPLKAAVGEERPYKHESIRVVGGEETSASFPSGHASFAFAYFVVLSAEFPARRRYFLGFAALIALSRLYLGQHYPADVLAGALLGLAAGYVSVKLYATLEKKLGAKLWSTSR